MTPNPPEPEVVGAKQGIDLYQTNAGSQPIIRYFTLPNGTKMQVRIAPGQRVNMRKELDRQHKAGLI